MNEKEMKVLEKHNIRINPDLDRYLDQPSLQPRLAHAHATLVRVGLPKA
jgi:hypothetical protein